jgi:EAL domain-containing protein (putative c-di-GMP-specific phosphodiesterase class I)
MTRTGHVLPARVKETQRANDRCAKSLDAQIAGNGVGRSAVARSGLLMAGLEQALAGDLDGLDVHYMPTIDIASRECSGFEALVRFTHPQLGPISPAVFVPIAEERGLACILGDFVRGRVVDDVEGGLLANGRVAVNVSALELADPQFADRFLDLLEQARLPGSRIGVEVTETAVAAHFAEAVEALRRLRAAGVSVALDDFGTGHASLDYLARLPCDTIKIDQSFVAGLCVDDGCAAIVAGVIEMAHATGHQVIAEGVETDAQFNALAALGCDEAQGYLFGQPARPGLIQGVCSPSSSQQMAAPPRLVSEPKISRQALPAQILVDLARDVGDAQNIATAFAIVITALRPLVDFTGGSVQVLGTDGIRLAAAHPPATEEALAARIPAGQGVAGSVIASGQLRYLPDITVPAAAVSADRRTRSTTRHTRSYLAVPIFVGTHCVGLVQLDSVEAEAFGPDIQMLLAGCAIPLGQVLARHAEAAGDVMS